MRTRPSHAPTSASEITEKAGDVGDATYGYVVDGGVEEEVQKRLLFPPIRRHRALIPMVLVKSVRSVVVNLGNKHNHMVLFTLS